MCKKNEFNLIKKQLIMWLKIKSIKMLKPLNLVMIDIHVKRTVQIIINNKCPL